MATENIGSLVVRFETDMSNFIKGFQAAETKLQDINNTVGRVTENIKNKLEGAVKGSQVFLGGVAAIGAGLATFGVKAITMAGQLEQAKVAFGVLLGSEEKAVAMMKDLQKFGAETPFEFPEIQQSAKSLLAFGIGAEDITETLRRVGDIASGVGAPLGDIAELFGKAKTQGRLFAEDINQLTGRGIPIIKELASQFKVSESEVRTLVESGKVGFPQLETAFKNMTSKGSQFGGMMEQQSKTLPGMWSNLMDNIGQSSRVFGDELIKTLNLKERLAGVIEWLGQVSALLQAEGLKGALEKLFPPELQTKLVLIAGAIAGALIPALVALTAGIWAAMVPLLPFMAAGAALAGLAFLIYKKWDGISEFFVNLWTTVKTKTLEIWDSVKTFLLEWWPVLVGALAGPIGMLAGYIYKNWDGIKTKTLEIWDNIKKAVVEKAKGWIDIGTNLAQGIWSGLQNMTSWLRDKVLSWIKTVLPDVVEKALGISSPSKVMEGYGENIAEGLALGIESGIDLVRDATTDLIAPVVGAVSIVSKAAKTFKDILTSDSPSDVKYGAFGMALENLIGSTGKKYDDLSNADIQAWRASAGSATIPKFAKGTNFVPFDTAAFLHKGEAVIPAKNNPANGGRLGGANITVNVTGNTISGSADEDRLAKKISQRIAADFGFSVGGAF